jgi:thiol-disulfide isomerase/thioredoxin
MKKTLLIAFTCLPFYLWAQWDLSKQQMALLQTKADTLIITHYLLNEPADKNFHSKFKVLEFWATWCRPCLRAVPHLNKLQSKFKDRNVVFLSFTYERPDKAATAFQKVNFESIVVSDTTKTTHRNLRVEYNGTMGLPRTILIDDENKIVWYGSPDKLTPKLMERFLRKEQLSK